MVIHYIFSQFLRMFEILHNKKFVVTIVRTHSNKKIFILEPIYLTTSRKLEWLFLWKSVSKKK